MVSRAGSAAIRGDPAVPYGFYTFLRLVVTAGALAAAFLNYRQAQRINWVVVAAVLVALLFNPLVPVPLTRGTWMPIDVAVGAGFVYLAWRRPVADKKPLR